MLARFVRFLKCQARRFVHTAYTTKNSTRMEVRSCFHEQVVAERLVVPPNYLSNVSSHVIAVLNRRLLVCTNKFHGVLVCYRDVKLLKRAAVIVDEHPYVHADIRYTATVFRPIRGTVLEVRHLVRQSVCISVCPGRT